MLFIFKTKLGALLRWIHLASAHRCVLGLVISVLYSDDLFIDLGKFQEFSSSTDVYKGVKRLMLIIPRSQTTERQVLLYLQV